MINVVAPTRSSHSRTTLFEIRRGAATNLASLQIGEFCRGAESNRNLSVTRFCATRFGQFSRITSSQVRLSGRQAKGARFGGIVSRAEMVRYFQATPLIARSKNSLVTGSYRAPQKVAPPSHAISVFLLLPRCISLHVPSRPIYQVRGRSLRPFAGTPVPARRAKKATGMAAPCSNRKESLSRGEMVPAEQRREPQQRENGKEERPCPRPNAS